MQHCCWEFNVLQVSEVSSWRRQDAQKGCSNARPSCLSHQLQPTVHADKLCFPIFSYSLHTTHHFMLTNTAIWWNKSQLSRSHFCPWTDYPCALNKTSELIKVNFNPAKGKKKKVCVQGEGKFSAQRSSCPFCDVTAWTLGRQTARSPGSEQMAGVGEARLLLSKPMPAKQHLNGFCIS